MAQASYVVSLFGDVDLALRRSLRAAFEHVLGELRFGPPDPATASENFAAHFYSSTTSSTANDEFTVPHQFGRAPYLVIPILPVTSSGGRVVRLVVTRPADAQYVYLASPDTSALIRLYIEG